MKAPFRRLPLAISLTAILTLALTGIVAANPISKTIDTQTCTSNTAEQCATYGPFGFTGTITFAADEVGTTVLLLDVICVNPVLAGGSFNTVGISGGTATGSTGSSTTYHLTLGGSTTGSYTLPSGQDCSDGKYNPFGDASGVSFFVSSATVSYSILLDGVTAANANS
ncbi:MAG: hypothetical protein ABI785_14565, partial [Gemmatimonadales bacterium]